MTSSQDGAEQCTPGPGPPPPEAMNHLPQLTRQPSQGVAARLLFMRQVPLFVGRLLCWATLCGGSRLVPYLLRR